MRQFAFSVDTDITFGVGSRMEVGRTAAAFGSRAVLVTGSRSLDASGHGAQITSSLSEAGVGLVERIFVSGEPDDHVVRETAERLANGSADVVVAVGGGSVMDLAKAAAIVRGGVDLGAALAGAPVTEPGTPVVALPTTAGSGAEVSRGAIILDRTARRKRGIRGRAVAPRMALVDPALTCSAGARITAEAGLDAVAHALETALSRVASPLNVLLAGEALRLLLDAVPRAIASPDDVGSRTFAAYAAMLMGLNLATASTCLPHRLQYPVGAATRTSHARGVAALLPAWLARTRRHAEARLAELAVRAGLPHRPQTSLAASSLVDHVTNWIDSIGMRTRLTDLGVHESDVPELARMAEGTLTNDPGPVGLDDLIDLYRESL